MKKSKAKQPVTDKDKPASSVGQVINAKKKQTEKLKNNSVYKHCPKCDRRYKRQDSLEKHIAKCKGGTGTNGGAREGAGRPIGSMNEKSIVLMEAKKKLQERIASKADELFNAQYNLAIGQTMLFVQIKERDSKGKVKRVYHERIENPETIKQYLDDNESLNDDDNYYYITTKPANNQAISNMLDRAFGKPKENLELGEDPDNPLSPVVGGTSELRKKFRDFMLESTKAKPKSKEVANGTS